MTVQLLNILFLGIHDNGKGSFFPEGVVGAINTPVGYNLTDTGLTTFPYVAVTDGQVGRSTHITPQASDLLTSNVGEPIVLGRSGKVEWVLSYPRMHVSSSMPSCSCH